VFHVPSPALICRRIGQTIQMRKCQNTRGAITLLILKHRALIYAKFLAGDGNFRLCRNNKGNGEQGDPSLVGDAAFYSPNESYKEFCRVRGGAPDETAVRLTLTASHGVLMLSRILHVEASVPGLPPDRFKTKINLVPVSYRSPAPGLVHSNTGGPSI
jgi:hypothetical protein